jgi:hypothetical protein
MRLPLVVFSLLLLLVSLIGTLAKGGGDRAGGNAVESLWERVFKDAVPAYLLLASLALTMIAFGKPTLLAQWGAWGVIVLQVGHGLARWREAARVRWALNLLILADLMVMWAYQLPYFDPLPN